MQRMAALADTKSLSDLLARLELAGQTWCYSDLGAHNGFSVAPGDALYFHAVLQGTARLACAGGDVVELGAGDAVFVLSGEAHALRTTSEAKATTHEFLREERQVDIPPTVPLTQG
ncbi:MAG: cupin domain-containing protein, partial [Novosphingobium sp.]|nr:cupin domain-containing protein [Novosphingobium sp.]